METTVGLILMIAAAAYALRVWWKAFKEIWWRNDDQKRV